MFWPTPPPGGEKLFTELMICEKKASYENIMGENFTRYNAQWILMVSVGGEYIMSVFSELFLEPSLPHQPPPTHRQQQYSSSIADTRQNLWSIKRSFLAPSHKNNH